MKKLIVLILIALFLSFVNVSQAFEPPDWSEPSAVQTADALIYTGPGFLYGVVCLTDGTNSVTFAVHDNTSATGTKLHPDIICTTSTTSRTCVYGFDPPVVFGTGVYVNITSSDATPDYVVYYRGQ